MCSGDDLQDASTTALVQMIQGAAKMLARREAPVSGIAAAELADALGSAIDLQEAALAPLIRRAEATGAFAEQGFASATAWARRRLGMGHGRAAERVRLARQLPRLAETRVRLTGGSASAGQANVIAGAVTRLNDEDAQLAEKALLDLADAGHSVNELTKAAAHITDVIHQQRDEQKEPIESRRGFQRSWITMSRSLDGGTWVRGWLTPEHAATFEQITGPLSKPAGPADDRDHAQRTADALFSVLSQGNGNAGVTIIIDLAAYTQATDTDTGTRPARTADDIATGPDDRELRRPGQTCQPARMSARPPARLLSGTEISVQRARQIALAAGINTLILGPSGAPLYLGRTVRLATAWQRKALQALYDTCCVAGCDIPVHLCEIHHLNGGWKLGTPTDITHLAPTCSYHNKWIDTRPERAEQRTDHNGKTTITLHPPWRPTITTRAA